MTGSGGRGKSGSSFCGPGDIARQAAAAAGEMFFRGDMLKAAARGTMAALLRCVVLSFA